MSGSLLSRRVGRKITGVAGAALLVWSGIAAADVVGAVATTASPGNSILGWGDNTYGETSGIVSLAGHDVVAVSAGDFYSLALKSDGTVVAAGYNADGRATVPPGLTGVIAISAGADNSLALKSDGTVVAWGGDLQGDTNVPAGLTGVTAISAGSQFSLALKSDGTVVGWGYGPDGATVPPGLTGVTAISAGLNSALALTSDGNVVAWGSNLFGQLDVPALPTGLTYTAVSSGDSFSVALRSDGTVVAWGRDFGGGTDVPPGLSGVVAISASSSERTLALKSDGTVVAWGSNQSGDTVVPAGLTHVSAISAGYAHSLVLVPTLTVTASARVLYGSGPATLTPSYSGFVDGDNSSVVSGVTCAAPVDATTPPGTYPATCSGGTAPGYVLNYVAGTVTVANPSGQDRVVASPRTQIEGLTGRTETLTFTATRDTKGLINGRFVVSAPTGWPAVSIRPTAPGFVTTTCGTISAHEGVTIDNVNLAPGGTCTVTYGDRSQGGPGVTAPMTVGAAQFGFLERSTAKGTVHPVVTNIGVDVTARPLVTDLSVHSGPATGGTAVTVTGQNFADGDTVLIGQGTGTTPPALSGANIQIVSTTQITFTTPPSAKAGPFRVIVIAPDGTPSLATTADQFTFTKGATATP